MAAILDFLSVRFSLVLIYKSPQCFLPSFKSTGFPVLEKKRKIDFQDGGHGGHLGFPIGTILAIFDLQVTPVLPTKNVREKSRECHNHKPQPFPDPKRKRKPTNLNKHKPNKRTKSTKISSLFPKRGNCNTKRTEKHKNKMTHGKTYNKSPRRINHKATSSKTNTGTTALERSVEQTTGGFKALLQLANFTLGPDATLNHDE